MACVKFITETKIFQQSGQTDTNANSVIFVNQGTSNVTIDGFLLTPNQRPNFVEMVSQLGIRILQTGKSRPRQFELPARFKADIRPVPCQTDNILALAHGRPAELALQPGERVTITPRKVRVFLPDPEYVI